MSFFSTRSLRPLLACLLCLSVAWMPPTQAQVGAPAQPADDDASVLVLGRVSDDPKSHYDQLKPLLDYVVPRMANVGIRSGRILMAKDLQQMTSYLRRGQVDWINETAGNAGLLVLMAGPDVVRIAPSLLIGLDEILEGLSRLETAVERALLS